MKVAVIFNQAFPYRTPVFDRVAQQMELTVLYLSREESNRQWYVPPRHPSIFIGGVTLQYGREYFLHINPSVIPMLETLKPEVVIVYGFGPTEQAAYIWTKLRDRKVISMADCWEHTERDRSARQGLIQRLMIKYADACIVCGHKSRNYFRDRGGKNIVISRITAGNTFKPSMQKNFDLAYVSQFVNRKMPYFIRELMEYLPDKTILIIGDGRERETLKQIRNGVYLGSLPGSEVSHWLPQAKILVMPTESDHWGLVANEALASGVPVFTTPYAGCSDDLIWDELNGWVRRADPRQWAFIIRKVLDNPELLKRMSELAVDTVKEYTIENSAKAMITAIKEACE